MLKSTLSPNKIYGAKIKQIIRIHKFVNTYLTKEGVFRQKRLSKLQNHKNTF